MYSGSDSTESQNYTQWALNPSAYQNVSSENVDWAALAQQWIIMKEAGPPVPEQATAVPVAPTIPSKLKKEVLTEGGEAPMDVENEKEDNVTGSQCYEPSTNPAAVADSWNWNHQQQWGWNNTWSAPAGVPPPGSAPGVVKAPLLPTPPGFNQFNPAHDTVNENTNFAGYNSVPPNDYTSGYWTAAGGSSKLKPHNKRFSKVNVPRAPVVPEPVTLDAAKRKQLPAWIREGLEKMERDKQKQLEKEREKQEKVVPVEKVKLSEQDALEIIKSTVKEQRSKFESDGEESEDSEIRGRALTPEPVPLTQEELMLKVRRTMTEILLNVTNREIYTICKEELQRHLKRAKASDQRVPAPSGTTLSATLGLGIYGGDSESSSDNSDSESQQDIPDSDAELKDAIRRRKADFSKTEREIEDRLAEAEKGSGPDSRAASSEANHNDSQVDAKIQGRKSRFNSSDERTPPPKPASQNSKHKTRKSSTSSDDSESDRDKNSKLTRNRRSTSSDSNSSEKRYNDRSSRNDRTPERRRKHSLNKSKSESVSKRSRSHSKRSRSKSRDSRRSRSRSHKGSRYSRRSRSRSRSRSKRSHSKSRRSQAVSRHKSATSRHSRSRSRHKRSSSRSSYTRNKRRSRSRRRSSSSSRRSYHYRRSRSSSSSRGKRSYRH